MAAPAPLLRPPRAVWVENLECVVCGRQSWTILVDVATGVCVGCVPVVVKSGRPGR